MRRSLLKWEIAGVIIIIAMGVMLHFIYDWSGGFKPLALVAAVNESTWEHLKLAFWPALLWAGLEYAVLGFRLPNLLVAKTVSFYCTLAFIVLLVNIYTAILGRHLLPVDISIFCLAVALGQLVSFLVLEHRSFCVTANLFSLCLLVLILSAFSVFTFYPPDLPLFIDPKTGLKGIPG
ncbi:MAG: DUF6512 family protein [Methylocystaceae bacterium]